MKTVEQVVLRKHDGDTVTICEVDLCRTAPDRFLVNYRQGAAGSVLSEGSETPLSVSEPEARRVFDAFVEARLAQGYGRDTDETMTRPTADEPPSTPESPPTPDRRHERLLQRLSEGSSGPANWPLFRAAWQCGEHRLSRAENLLVGLLGTGDAMLDYCLAWALGQCGTDSSIPVLRQLEAEHEAPSVRRIAGVSLLELLPGDQLAVEQEECIRQLPSALQSSASGGPPEEFAAAFEQAMGTPNESTMWLPEIIYLIDNEQTRPALLTWLRSTSVQAGTFHNIRHIFKAAELRRDAQVFATLALRFERSRENFRMQPRWYYPRRVRPTEGEHPEQAFSAQTKDYLQRRCWRTLRRLVAANQHQDYIRMASAILLEYTDEDGTDPWERTTYVYDRQRRRYDYVTSWYDRFRFCRLLNRILYSNSSRYQLAEKGLWQCVPPWQPGHQPPDEREEAWPELWDQHPETVLCLLKQSRCAPVHEFAVRVLVEAREFCSQLNSDDVVSLLKVPYEVTLLFALVHAVRIYEAEDPDATLLSAMCDCGMEQVRRQAYDWLNADAESLLHDSELVVRLVCSPQEQTRATVRELLRSTSFSAESTQVLAGRIISALIRMDDTQQQVAAAVTETLQIVFGGPLRQLGESGIRDLADHSLPAVQRLAAELIVNHATLASVPPIDTVRRLLDSEDESVRGAAVRVLGQASSAWLQESSALLFHMIRHPHQNVRDASESLLTRLAASAPQEADELTLSLVQALLIPGAPDGVPSHTAHVLRDCLADFLNGFEIDTVWALLHSRSAPAQEIGGVLLSTVEARDLDLLEIARLASHEIQAVREAAWQHCQSQLDRLRETPESLALMADSGWEDSRRFAFEFLEQHFAEPGALPPDVLIRICDSVRPEVQQFGRRLIGRAFMADHGETYLVRLSEHPSEEMQLFASGFLEEHATDNPRRMEELKPFFVSVLSRVNRGRTARTRVLKLLLSEAAKDQAAAQVAVEILTRVSATVAIQDRANIVAGLLDIADRWPELDSPLELRPVEVRGAV